jgi:hypothetical protein
MSDNGASELSDFEWFSRCGKPLPSWEITVLPASSWTDAANSCAGSEWQDLTQDAKGNLTEHLSLRYPSRYQGVWNRTVSLLRPRIEATVTPELKKIQLREGFDDFIIECVKSDVLFGLMTRHYADCKPPDFFLRLLSIYRSGHFPCGVIGGWPGGAIKVY